MRTQLKAAAVIGAAAMALLSACSGGQQRPVQVGDDSPYNGTPIEGAFTLPDITLTDTHGEDYNLAQDSKDEFTAVFFGFTNCPDICPTTMADLSLAVEKLEPEVRKKVNVVFVSVDPDRDTPELIGTWLDSFNESFTGLTGSTEKVDKAADQLGISVDRPAPEDRKGNYNVAHGGQTLVFSPGGESELMWRYGTKPSAMAEDLTMLVKEA